MTVHDDGDLPDRIVLEPLNPLRVRGPYLPKLYLHSLLPTAARVHRAASRVRGRGLERERDPIAAPGQKETVA